MQFEIFLLLSFMMILCIVHVEAIWPQPAEINEQKLQSFNVINFTDFTVNIKEWSDKRGDATDIQIAINRLMKYGINALNLKPYEQVNNAVPINLKQCDRGQCIKELTIQKTCKYPKSQGQKEYESRLAARVAALKKANITRVPILSQNEAYHLWLEEAGPNNMFSIHLCAEELVGIFNGVESLIQSFEYNYNKDQTIQLVASTEVIIDYPLYPWRGFMIDSARHFMPRDTILEILDAMHMMKLNILHWHVTDAESFPFLSQKEPELSLHGAYDPHFAVYSPEDVKVIVDYATERGIVVLPEFDMPGHAASWGKSNKNIIAHCPKYEHNINNIALNPTNEETYKVLDNLFSDITAQFPFPRIHIGGDEVVLGCWGEDPSVQKFMKDHQYTLNDVRVYFQQRLEKIYRKYNVAVNGWQELLLSTQYVVPDDTIIQCWESVKDFANIISAGYFGVNSAGWYLEKQSLDGSSHHAWQDTWIDAYNLDIATNVPENQKIRVLGGEGAMWGETVSSADIIAFSLPRLAPVAERLWSPAWQTTSASAAAPRLSAFSCRLRFYGIHSGPIQPDFCIMDVFLHKHLS